MVIWIPKEEMLYTNECRLSRRRIRFRKPRGKMQMSCQARLVTTATLKSRIHKGALIVRLWQKDDVFLAFADATNRLGEDLMKKATYRSIWMNLIRRTDYPRSIYG